MLRIPTPAKSANAILLHQQLITALPIVCAGITIINDVLYVELADNATPADITTALAVVAAHDPDQETVEQAAIRIGSGDITDLLFKAAATRAQIATKLTAVQTTPTVETIGALVAELADDTIGILKALEYALKHLS